VLEVDDSVRMILKETNGVEEAIVGCETVVVCVQDVVWGMIPMVAHHQIVKNLLVVYSLNMSLTK